MLIVSKIGLINTGIEFKYNWKDDPTAPEAVVKVF